jgi:hypothetical protein
MQTVRAIALVSMACLAVGAEKRDWQRGKLLDSERSNYFAGTVGNSNTTPNVYGASTTGSQTALYRVFQNFVIEGEMYVYLAQERIKWRWSKPANLTVNGPVKYVVGAKARKLYVLDEEGKEHEMEIIKKVLREATPQQ